MLYSEERFRVLDRDGRKKVLARLHEVRPLLEGSGDTEAVFLGWLRHLEDVHKDLVEKRGCFA